MDCGRERGRRGDHTHMRWHVEGVDKKSLCCKSALLSDLLRHKCRCRSSKSMFEEGWVMRFVHFGRVQ